MSDQEMRQVLKEVIEDLDSGRIRIPRRPGTLTRLLAPPLVAATMGLSAMACDARSLGQDPGDTDAAAQVQQDAAAEVPTDASVNAPDAAPPVLDGGLILMYGEPWLPDSGLMPAYGEPWLPDAGEAPAYAHPFIDAGFNEDYGVPPILPDAGAEPLYAAPEPEAAPPGSGDEPEEPA